VRAVKLHGVEPHKVCLGAQKNFNYFVNKLEGFVHPPATSRIKSSTATPFAREFFTKRLRGTSARQKFLPTARKLRLISSRAVHLNSINRSASIVSGQNKACRENYSI
jgi:hypothetical protein